MKQKSIKFLPLIALVCNVTQVLAQSDPATIPDELAGTYTGLTFALNNPPSQFAEGDTKSFVVTLDDKLCVDGYILTDPYIRNGFTVEAFWDVPGSDTKYSIVVDGRPFEALYPYDGNRYLGEFKGERTSLDTQCDGKLSSELSISSTAEDIFALAEQYDSSIFGDGSELRSIEGFVYRFYEKSAVYLAFKEGFVYLFRWTLGR